MMGSTLRALTNWASELQSNPIDWLISTNFRVTFQRLVCRLNTTRPWTWPSLWRGVETNWEVPSTWGPGADTRYMAYSLCPWPSLWLSVETNWGDEGRQLSVYTSGLKCQLHLTQTQLAAFLSSSVSSSYSDLIRICAFLKIVFGRWHRYYCSIVGLGEKARRYAEDLERFNLTQTQVALLSAFFSPSVSSSYWDSIRICAFFKIGLKLCWGPVKAPVYHFSTVVCSLLH